MYYHNNYSLAESSPIHDPPIIPVCTFATKPCYAKKSPGTNICFTADPHVGLKGQENVQLRSLKWNEGLIIGEKGLLKHIFIYVHIPKCIIYVSTRSITC